jgi:hypothetical protein
VGKRLIPFKQRGIEMLGSLLDSIFGCSHSRTTFPLTPSRRAKLAPESSRQGTYIVCLDCGKEFAYNWKEMRVGNAVAVSPVIASPVVANR